MELMLLHLTNDPDTVEYSIFNQSNNTASINAKVTITDAVVEAAKHTAIIFAVSGNDVISIEKNLPKMPSSKIAKALPFAIEEQLLESIDAYHLVITNIQQNGNIDLLAVLYQKMQQWLSSFHKRITFSTMLPDYLFLPYEPDVWHITIENYVLIRYGKYLGLSCDLENWQQIVTLLWQEQTPETQPKKIIIHHYSHISLEQDNPHPSPLEKESASQESTHEQIHSPLAGEGAQQGRVRGTQSTVTKREITTNLLNSLPVIIEQQNETVTLLQNMAKQAAQENLTISLLQNEFAQEHHLSPVKKTWLFAGGMLATALIIGFLSTIVQFIMLKRQDNVLQTQIAALYKQVYPESSTVVAPQVRMERTLKDLQANQSGGGYLGLLVSIGQVFKQLPAIQVNTLRYQDNKLVLEVQANNFNVLDLALNMLNKTGVMATQDQGATKDNLVTARFTIQEKQ